MKELTQFHWVFFYDTIIEINKLTNISQEDEMLIDSVLYKAGRRIKNERETDHIIDYLKNDSEAFVWMAFQNPEGDELENIARQLGVHELALEDIRHGNQITKLEEYDENVFIVMKSIKLSPTELVENDVYFLVGPQYVITVRNNNTDGFAPVRRRAERDYKLLTRGPSYVVYAVMDAIVDRYFPVITVLENEVDRLEKEIFSEGGVEKRDTLKKFHDIKERIRSAKLVIFPLSAFIGKLSGGRVPEVFDDMDMYFRDIHDHLKKIQASLDYLTETAVAGVNTSVALIAIEDNKVTKKLAAWAAIFAASTSLAGIWGMNFKGMPELEWQYGYPFALLTIFSVAAALYFKFKRAKWM